MSTWHLEQRLIDGYVTGNMPASAVASVETHVLACDECRRRLGRQIDAGRLTAVWDEVVERVDAPRPTVMEWLLLRAGVPEGTARLLASAPSLSVSWLCSMAVALIFALLAADAGARGTLIFLILAPILPVAGVAASYGRGVDPTYDVGLAAPYSTFRLLLLRSSAVLGSTLVLVGLAALLLPVAPWVASAWLLPSLALTGATLAASTRVDTALAAVGIVVAWVTAVLTAYRSTGAPYAAFGETGQIVCAAVLLLSIAVLTSRNAGNATDLGRIP
ncbi:MAG: zf-HC2 domain-containing protein [Actinomycetota bacterium]|nr:zf-HC2 domain-containing protein [Actinomycetota bacterium]